MSKELLYRIIRNPVVTEKSVTLGSDGCFVFDVLKSANKVQIKQAIETAFSVKVVAVRTSNRLGKVKRVGTSVGQRSTTKKAYIQLAPGFSIDIAQGV